jgi:hypothetical protein
METAISINDLVFLLLRRAIERCLLLSAVRA